jgi:hypothetical protein
MTETESKWVERIRQWRDSGKGAEEFASGRPFKASTLKWWATELRRRADGRSRTSKPRVGTSPIRMARVFPRPGARGHGKGQVPGNGLVIEVSGARISLGRGFDAGLLAEVVRALGGER